MDKEEILDKYAIGVAAGEYAIEYDKAHLAMDEYAMELLKYLREELFIHHNPKEVYTLFLQSQSK